MHFGKHSSPHIFDVDEKGFDKQVLEASSEKPILIDFWADWCSPCISLAPHLERVINDYDGEVLLGKVEVDDNMRLAGRYKLKGFPTVILYRDGEEKARFAGSRPSHWIRQWIDEHLA